MIGPLRDTSGAGFGFAALRDEGRYAALAGTHLPQSAHAATISLYVTIQNHQYVARSRRSELSWLLWKVAQALLEASGRWPTTLSWLAVSPCIEFRSHPSHCTEC